MELVVDAIHALQKLAPTAYHLSFFTQLIPWLEKVMQVVSYLQLLLIHSSYIYIIDDEKVF